MDAKEKMWAEIRPTGRPAEEYFKDLGISLEFLEGKKVLDIGSGLNQFAKDLRKHSLDLVSVDTFYALTPEQREKVFEELTPENFEVVKKDLDRIIKKKKDSQLVGGLAESLPFADESFDVVLAEFSMPNHAESFSQARDFFFEIARVLKSKGEGRIYPMRFRKRHELGPDIQQKTEGALNELREKGFNIEIVGDGLLIINRVPTFQVGKVFSDLRF